jgi:hypothetical protein
MNNAIERRSEPSFAQKKTQKTKERIKVVA